MKFVAIIPARYASTRFPGKPLALINGKPMIQHVYERTAELFDHCFVATDDERIRQAVKEFDGNVVMTSSEHQSGTDRCAEALELIEQRSDAKFDVVINVQGDEPFICKEQLVLIRNAFEQPATQIATLVKQFKEEEDIFNPNSPKVVISNEGFAIYFSRSVIPFMRGVDKDEWQTKGKFYKHIGLYAYRANVLREITKLPISNLEKVESLEQLRWIESGYRIKVEETSTEAISVDTPEDLQRILKLIQP